MEKTKFKTAKQMERHFKGIANRRRIEILLFTNSRKAPRACLPRLRRRRGRQVSQWSFTESSDGITLDSIISSLNANGKTIGEHARRLFQAGLINKKYRGKFVEHRLSPYGRIFAKFLKSFRAT